MMWISRRAESSGMKGNSSEARTYDALKSYIFFAIRVFLRLRLIGFTMVPFNLSNCSLISTEISSVY
jgi:hypothetical protein